MIKALIRGQRLQGTNSLSFFCAVDAEGVMAVMLLSGVGQAETCIDLLVTRSGTRGWGKVMIECAADQSAGGRVRLHPKTPGVVRAYLNLGFEWRPGDTHNMYLDCDASYCWQHNGTGWIMVATHRELNEAATSIQAAARGFLARRRAAREAAASSGT